jgi:TonB family protein
MSEMWKQWVGRTVDGKFPLQAFLGGSAHSAVFLTQGTDSRNVAIKLISAESANAEKQFLRWKTARELKHPNLIGIYEAGRCKLDDATMLYVVEEYAEENLAQILPERALTPEEVRDMLPPLLRALEFVHDNGLVHGHIQPSNILAIGEEVKLSSDTLRQEGAKDENFREASAYGPPEAATVAGSAAGDVWQLGMTVVAVLTQKMPPSDRSRKTVEVPETIPEPVREIVSQCLQLDPQKRWTVSQILDRLDPDRTRPARKERVLAKPKAVVAAPGNLSEDKASSKWPYAVGLATLVALGLFLIVRPKSASSPEGQPTELQQVAPSDKTQAVTTGSAASGRDSTAPSARTTNAQTTVHDNQGDVVRRVVPEVAPSARRTVHGKIVVRVRVDVDAAGNVSKAKIESGAASKYFKRIALEASQNWKFSAAAPGDATDHREWKLQFTFSRAKTEASATHVNR